MLNNNEALTKQIRIKDWVYKPGIPDNIPPVSSVKFKAIDSLIAGSGPELQVNDWSKRIHSPNELLYFLNALPDTLTSADMALLDKEFRFTQSGNAEIQALWYTLAIRHKYQPAYPNIERFLTEVGRRKFLMPLYKEMAKTTQGKMWAKKIYVEARPNYHSIAHNSIDELLK